MSTKRHIISQPSKGNAKLQIYCPTKCQFFKNHANLEIHVNDFTTVILITAILHNEIDKYSFMVANQLFVLHAASLFILGEFYFSGKVKLCTAEQRYNKTVA